MFTFEHIEEALASSYLRKQVPLRFSLFDWQKRFLLSAANEAFVVGKLPTGSGKSMCYIMFPYIIDYLKEYTRIQCARRRTKFQDLENLKSRLDVPSNGAILIFQPLTQLVASNLIGLKVKFNIDVRQLTAEMNETELKAILDCVRSGTVRHLFCCPESYVCQGSKLQKLFKSKGSMVISK